jgi:D-cysteine desulfhydrase
VPLATLPTPVERLGLPGAGDGSLWVKRDDLTAEPIGGNKVRALEFLLGHVRPGDEVLTVGAEGSTHALATALHAARLGARTTVVGWRQEMNPDAVAVRARLIGAARRIDARSAPIGLVYAWVLRLRGARRAAARLHWVPAGGTSPRGMLGHVNAALELAEQVAAGALPRPARVVVPLGSGGTAAGLALGFALASLDVTVVGARVVPRVVANAARLRRLIGSTARLIERETGERLPRPPRARLVVTHDEYGGAYGRATAAGRAAVDRLRGASGGAPVTLDATYGAKAGAAALALASTERPAREGTRPTLLWLTFDGRWLAAHGSARGLMNHADRAR